MDEDREQKVNSARHSQVMSGGDISETAQKLSEEYISSGMTSDEMRRRVLSECGLPEDQTPQISEI